MKIVLAGGSGFIGKKLTSVLIKEGHEVVILTRKRKTSSDGMMYVEWLKEGTKPEKEIKHADIFVNLAGVSINDGRWTARHQRQIYDSRMTATDELTRIIAALPQKPLALINASAIGIYPSSLESVYSEESTEKADDFLSKTVSDWENKANRVEAYGVRTAYMRFGVVLGGDGGALPLMSLPYKLYVGGTIGTGKQWVSWIHIEDAVRAMAFVIEHEHLTGPVNITAPTPVRMKEFGQTIGTVLNRPHWFPVPAFVMKMVLGKKSNLVLEGQKVLPKALMDHGFEFSFPKLELALEDLLLSKE